jgi:hypothetical protein
MAEPSSTPTGGGPLVPTKSIAFPKNIDGPDTADGVVTAELIRDMPYDGVITRLFLDIPAGVRSRAGFKLLDGERGERQFPYNEETEFAAFNDVNGFWPVTFPMREGDEIVVKYINKDERVDEHFIKVWVVAVGIEALPYTLEEIAEREGVNL